MRRRYSDLLPLSTATVLCIKDAAESKRRGGHKGRQGAARALFIFTETFHKLTVIPLSRELNGNAVFQFPDAVCELPLTLD